MQEFHWRSSRLGAVSQGFVGLCAVHSRRAACEEPRGWDWHCPQGQEPARRAVHSEHPREAQDHEEVQCEQVGEEQVAGFGSRRQQLGAVKASPPQPAAQGKGSSSHLGKRGRIRNTNQISGFLRHYKPSV